MNLRTMIMLALVVVASCGKDKNGDKGNKGDKHTPPKQMTIAEALGTTKKAALIGPYASAKFGMSDDELKTAVPLYAEKGDYLSPQDYGIGFYASVTGPPADESAKKAKKRFTGVIVAIKDADAAALKAAWGAPTEIQYRGKPASVWLNADDHIRAILEAGDAGEKKLGIAPYLSSKWILGEPGKPLGIESKRAFLGATPAELEAAYPENYDRTLENLTFMTWQPDDFDSEFKIELGMKDGKVATLQYWISHGDNETVKAAKKAEIEAKYGVAKEVKTEYQGPQLVMSENPKVTLAETKGAWVVEVGYP